MTTPAKVARAGLCSGCGLCEAEFGAASVSMRMSDAGYLRPFEQAPLGARERQAFARTCPGIRIDAREVGRSAAGRHPLWGPVASVRSGWARDGELRHHASSGGALSALLLSLLARGRIAFVLQTTADGRSPLDNRTVLNRAAADVVAAAGSRYGPSSPLAALPAALQTGERFAFVGKPCDVAALRAYVAERPEAGRNIELVVSFFCAGVPSRESSVELVRTLGVSDPAEVESLRYRGNGWPGRAALRTRDGREASTDYDTAWGTVLNRGLQWRCKVCPDGTGELADVSFADAWEIVGGKPSFAERPGRSLIVARSARGEDAVEAALASEFLVASETPIDAVEAMQPHQAEKKRVALARLLASAIGRGPRFRSRGLGLVAAARRATPKELAVHFLAALRRRRRE